MGGVVRGVARHAESLALQEVRSVARTRMLDGAPGGFVDRQHVVAVHDFGRHVVGRAAVGHVGAGHLQGDRRRVGVLVVVADEHHRQLLHGGEVHALVPVAAAGRAFAEIGKDHAVLALIAERQSGARRYRNGGRQGADDGNDVEVQIAHVHVGVAAAGDAAGAPHVLCQDAAGSDAADEKHGHVAVGREQNVVRLGRERGAHRDGFLPASHVDAADDLALAVELALDAVFHLAHE